MPNRLSTTTSPYLLQHRDNPVDWYPWGEEALSRAEREAKPVLLSVGYAACHWCHVMAHESFEDPVIADLMNRLFINIKVDREERPDLDAIYQSALALMGQPGGWPLTMFLTPDGRPFAGGTYFPPAARYGRPGFADVLQDIARIYDSEPERVRASGTAVNERLQTVLNPTLPGVLSIKALDDMAARLVRQVDPFHGGFGEAPKFPNTPIFEFLWRAYHRTGREPYARAVVTTLTHMAQGGIYDHLGGGFARYSVDETWLVPHFEKMLYDNAQMIALMTRVWQATALPLLKDRTEETIGWAMREMRLEGGAFAASIDADSQGHEGLFYVWTRDEILKLLGPEDGEHFCSVYGVTREGNFEGANILNRLDGEPFDETHEVRLAPMRRKLLEARAHRVRPGLDDKILADWNGLMIAALARAGAAFERDDWLEAAESAFRFVRDRMSVIPPGAGHAGDRANALLHSLRAGVPGQAALAEDYANMIAAAIALDESTGRDEFVSSALGWLHLLERDFAAPGGGFFQSPITASDVIIRSRTVYDNAVPPANATMLENYARLYHQLGDRRFRDSADAILSVFAGVAEKAPAGTATLLNAFEILENASVVVLRFDDEGGQRSAKDAAGDLFRVLQRSSDPCQVLAFAGGDFSFGADHPAAQKTLIGGRPTVYVCRGQTCSLPITDAPALAAALKAP